MECITSISTFLVRAYEGMPSLLSLSGAGIVMICLAAANVKSWPFVWHIRLGLAIFAPFIPATKTFDAADCSRLFYPVRTTSRSPLWECDYNMHKSNSSYYTDLDIARVDLLVRLFGVGLDQLPKHAHPGLPQLEKRTFPVLGGAICSFQHEIAPYQRYTMSTQVLCWDRKWFYIMTQFTTDDPGKDLSSTQHATAGEGRPTVCATAIMKIVFKSGRVTVPPEVLIRESGLIPKGKAAIWEAKRKAGVELARRHGTLVDLSSVEE